MIIKRYTIGSDDDDFTVDHLAKLPEIPCTVDSATHCVRADEMLNNLYFSTHKLEAFTNEHWQAAYAEGYLTFASVDVDGGYNEIVYLIKES